MCVLNCSRELSSAIYLQTEKRSCQRIRQFSYQVDPHVNRCWHCPLSFRMVSSRAQNRCCLHGSNSGVWHSLASRAAGETSLISSSVGGSYNWVSAENRMFRVHIGDRVSRWRIQKNDLPQESALAPTLFNIYINDLSQTISRKFIYADDICCATQAKTFKS